MRIAIGSTSPCKVEAVKEAWTCFADRIITDRDEIVDFLAYDVGLNNKTPLDVSSLMRGAEKRVDTLILQLKRERSDADFYVGLEGGFNVVDNLGPRRQAFLESWVYVSDGHRGSYGHGAGILVPPDIADPVIDRGIELGIVIDRFRGENAIQNGQGPWTLLTHQLLDRKQSFVTALIAAFAPFYNVKAYS